VSTRSQRASDIAKVPSYASCYAASSASELSRFGERTKNTRPEFFWHWLKYLNKNDTKNSTIGVE
jgi:hypothetical protein